MYLCTCKTFTKKKIYNILVQSKALAGAKSFGSFLYSAVNKAGKTVSEASAKIKKTVEENVSVLCNFILIYTYCNISFIEYFGGI